LRTPASNCAGKAITHAIYGTPTRNSVQASLVDYYTTFIKKVKYKSVSGKDGIDETGKKITAYPLEIEQLFMYNG